MLSAMFGHSLECGASTIKDRNVADWAKDPMFDQTKLQPVECLTQCYIDVLLGGGRRSRIKVR